MKIVCLGDSLTAGYGVRPEECWVSLLNAQTPHTWINAGICGDTTGGMLARLNESVFSREPDAAVLLGGINDILTSGSWSCAKANMTALVCQCAARGIRPIVGIPLPVRADAPHPWEAGSLRQAAAQADAYADWLRLFARRLRLRTADFNAACRLCVQATDWDRTFLPDGLHPSPCGHRAMAHAAGAQKFLRGGHLPGPC
jgi:lysophospholipase L1-like esterase